MPDRDVDVASEGSPRTVTIPGRYNGPPTSSNGGYACGSAAALLGPASAEVTLRRPPPLDRPLRAERNGLAVELYDEDDLVLEAEPIERLDAEVPEPVSVAEAELASVHFPWCAGHPFPTCFVCGPERPTGDGLRIFAGPVGGRGGLCACVWTPTPELADGEMVRPELIWAALDCPSAVPAASLAGGQAAPAVLARLAASLEAPVRAGETHVVLSWPLGIDGRKRAAGSAVVGPDGGVRARARALWIELRQ